MTTTTTALKSVSAKHAKMVGSKILQVCRHAVLFLQGSLVRPTRPRHHTPPPGQGLLWHVPLVGTISMWWVRVTCVVMGVKRRMQTETTLPRLREGRPTALHAQRERRETVRLNAALALEERLRMELRALTAQQENLTMNTNARTVRQDNTRVQE